MSECSGYVVDEGGADPALIKKIKEVARGRAADYVAERPAARLVTGVRIW